MPHLSFGEGPRRHILGLLVVTTIMLGGLGFFAAITALVGSSASPPPIFNATPGLDAGKIPYPYQSQVAGHVTVVADPLGGPHKVMRFAIADSDRPYSGASNPRADFETAGYFTNGSDLYSSIRFLIPAGFPALGSGFFQIMEIYGPPHGGSPTIGIDLFAGAGGRPVVSLQRDAAHGYDRPWTSSTPISPAWHTITVHSVMSTSASTGLVQVWYDGVAQTFSTGSQTINYATLGASNWDGHSPNILNVNSYRRAGAYPGTVTTYHGPAMVGPTYASVQDGSGTTTTSSSSSTTTSSSTTSSSTTTASPTTAAFTASPSPSTIGTAVTFTGAGSVCGAAPCSYRYSDANNNATLGTAQASTFTFHYAGTKKVLLTVIDAAGKTATVEHDLIVK